MLNNLLKDVKTVYIAYGYTDFRKQMQSLYSLVQDKYLKNPYENACYIFCNKKRDSIKVLVYDKNGFILAQKKLLERSNMKYNWPRNADELKSITKEQLRWLLSGLEIYPKKYFKELKYDEEKAVI